MRCSSPCRSPTRFCLSPFPSRPLIALGLWWNANTVSHNFVHLPFFRSPVLNRGYSIYLTLLLAIPHSLWRERHLRHHSGRDARDSMDLGDTRRGGVGCRVMGRDGVGGCGVLRNSLSARVPHRAWPLLTFTVTSNMSTGRPVTTAGSTTFFFSTTAITSSTTCDRARTGRGFRVISALMRPVAAGRRSFAGSISSASNRSSGLVLRSSRLQRYVIASHERAFRALLPKLPDVRRVTIVGGGLFPRTALVLRRVMPAAPLTIVDASARNIEIARTFLDETIEFRHCTYQPDPAFPSNELDEGHLVVIPLAFMGDRERIYREPERGLHPRPRLDMEASRDRRDGVVAVAQDD